MKVLNWTGLRLKCAVRKPILLVSLFCAFALPSHGQQSINLNRALELTLSNNTELKIYPLIIRGAEAMQLQAGLQPNLVMDVDVENAFGTGSYQGMDSSEISLSLSKLIELGDKRFNRVKFANAETQQLKTEYELARLDVLAETGRRYYRALALQEQQAWVERRVKKELEALKIIQNRAKAGAVGKADVSKMALRLSLSKLLQQQLSDDLKQAYLRLASMWISVPQFSSLVGSLGDLPTAPDSKTINKALDKLPSVLNLLALQRLADSRLKLAHSNGASDMTFGLGIKQHQLTSEQSLNVSFSMPLEFENPNKGRIQSAQIALNKSVKQIGWHKKQLNLTLLEIQQQLISLQSRASAYKQELLPQANELLVETERGYQKGRYSVLQWVDAQSELFKIEDSMIKTHLLIHTQFLELERITGQSMYENTSKLIGAK